MDYMSSEHKDILLSNNKVIYENVTFRKIAALLIQREVINLEEYEYINGRSTNKDRITQLILTIIQKKDLVFNEFILILQECEYKHVINELHRNSVHQDVSLMTEEHKKKIRSKITVFTQNIKYKEISDFLIEKEVIDYDDNDEIISKKPNEMLHLLAYILPRKPDSAFFIFMDRLLQDDLKHLWNEVYDII